MVGAIEVTWLVWDEGSGRAEVDGLTDEEGERDGEGEEEGDDDGVIWLEEGASDDGLGETEDDGMIADDEAGFDVIGDEDGTTADDSEGTALDENVGSALDSGIDTLLEATALVGTTALSGIVLLGVNVDRVEEGRVSSEEMVDVNGSMNVDEGAPSEVRMDVDGL